MKKNSSPILGVGNDLIEVERIRHSIEVHGDHFLMRLFTPNEQEYCLRHKDAAPHFSGRFAAKEAIAKALGCGFGEKLSWLDIEILPNEIGNPLPTFSTRLSTEFDDPHILLSISHTKVYATAVAIWIS